MLQLLWLIYGKRKTLKCAKEIKEWYFIKKVIKKCTFSLQ